VERRLAPPLIRVLGGPSGKMRDRKLSSLAAMAFENGLRLHEDSVLLFEHGSYGSALALSVLGLEELGKYFIVEDVVWNADINGPWSPADKKAWLLWAYNHRLKQSKAAWLADLTVGKRVQEMLEGGALEAIKHSGLYVGLPRKGRRDIDLLGRITNPLRVGRRRTAKQITLLSDFLLVYCVGVRAGTLGCDVYDVEDRLTMRLAHQLRRLWPRIGRRASNFVRQLRPSLLTRSNVKRRGRPTRG
jgi:AbiV family abortive infection protein